MLGILGTVAQYPDFELAEVRVRYEGGRWVRYLPSFTYALALLMGDNPEVRDHPRVARWHGGTEASNLWRVITSTV